MKIKITIGGNDRLALVLSAEHAALAAGLLANATVYEREGYYSTSGWKTAEVGVQINYTDGADLEPTHPKAAEAQKQYSEANSARWEEHRKREAAEKELAETKAALAALQAVTVCTQTAAGPSDEEPIDRVPELPEYVEDEAE